MPRTMLVLAHAVALAGAAGCATTASTGSTAPPSASPPPAAAPEHAEAAAARALCAEANRLAADRSRPASGRWQELHDWVESPDRSEQDHAFAIRVQESSRQTTPEEGVHAALAAVGLADLPCDGLPRLRTLTRSGEDDIDPALAASAADDLARLCAIASDPSLETIEPAARATRMAARIDAALTNPGIRRAFAAIAMAAPEQRYELLQAAAREEGVPGWTCPALQVQLTPSP